MHACQRPFGESPKNHPFLWMQASLTKRRLNLYILGQATQKPTRKDAIWQLLTFVNFWESNRWTVAWKSFCCYVFGIIDLAFLYQIPLFSLAIFHQSYSTGFFSSIFKRYDQVVNKGDSFRSRQSSLNSSIECLSQVFKSQNPPIPEASLKDSLSQVFLPFSISLNCRDIYSWHLKDIIQPKQYNEVHSNWSYTHARIVSKNFSYFLACSWHLMLSSLKIPRSLSQIFFPFSTSSFLNPLFPVFCAIQPNKSENPGES